MKVMPMSNANLAGAMRTGQKARLAALLAAAAWMSEPALAQRAKPVPHAFAAVQAPESTFEVCHRQSSLAALDCARRRCEKKAGRGACFAVTVCEPAGWSGLVGVQLAEVHFSKAVCGAPSQDALMGALKAFCLGHTGLKQCSVTQAWAPDGKSHAVEVSWTSADLPKK